VRAGVLNGDRESAAVVTLARLFDRRGGAICSVADNLMTGEKFVSGAGHNNAIETALEGMAVLHKMDRQREKAGTQIWLPSLAND
jgi:uridine phosphorylase